EGGIKQVQVSIDGPKAVHDRRRIFRGGGSSFDAIVDNVDLLLARGGTLVQIRAHVDPANLHDFEQLLDFFDDRGWIDHPDVVVYANTVYAKDGAGQVSARMENGDIAARLKALTANRGNVFLSAAAVNARMLLMPSLAAEKPYRLKSTYCSANTGQYIF